MHDWVGERMMVKCETRVIYKGALRTPNALRCFY